MQQKGAHMWSSRLAGGSARGPKIQGRKVTMQGDAGWQGAVDTKTPKVEAGGLAGRSLLPGLHRSKQAALALWQRSTVRCHSVVHPLPPCSRPSPARDTRHK